MESIVLTREVGIAARAALAFGSASAWTIPSAYFWFGQIMNHTLYAMTRPSHMPTPIA
jgi:hypothetical protein